VTQSSAPAAFGKRFSARTARISVSCRAV
jgi:hypothetical protein